ncbi:MAG: Ig-like domain-containing protein, partial [Desulfuromonadales bacterium]|nr:Ig-like domain-containing protein [Desulfuromonadales bacterium]
MANQESSGTQGLDNAATTTSMVVVPVTAPGETQTVSFEAGQIPQLTFDPGTESTQEFVGNDLVFTLDNGAVLTFEDFAADINDGNVAAIMLPDGTIIPIAALMEAWSLEVPETAAGAAPESGGGGEYDDDLGDILGTIGRLGPQDPDALQAEPPAEPLDDQQIIPNEPPVATPNTGTIVNGQEELFADGNLISNIEGGMPDSDPNDDPLTVISVGDDTSGTVQGEYGTLTWNPDGSYTYTVTDTDGIHSLDEGETLTDNFIYTVSDGELTDSADLIVTLEGVNDPPGLAIQAGSNLVYEAGLPNGSGVAPTTITTTGTFTITDLDGLDDIQSVSINGSEIAIDALVGSEIAGSNGTLTVTAYNAATGTGSYSYQLTSPTTDLAGPETDVFTLSVSDGTVSSAPADILVEIVDDVPTAGDINLGTQTEDATVELNVFDISGTAGGADGSTLTNVVVDQGGAAGSVSFDAAGNVTFTPAPEYSGPVSLTYTITDADQDPAQGNITLAMPADSVPEVEGGTGTVYEAGLVPDGTEAGVATTTVSGLFNIDTGNDGFGGLYIDGVLAAAGDTFTSASNYGTLTITDGPNGLGWSYTINEEETHADAAGNNTLNDSFSVSVQDDEGTTSATQSIDITIVDDVPTVSILPAVADA